MDLRHYIQGNRKGKEANRIEREAMNDPFLADALEGYDRLQKLDGRKIGQIRKDIRHKTNRRYKFIRNFSAAASLLLCIAFGSYFLFNTNRFTDHNQVAQSSQGSTLEEVEIIHPDSSEDNTLALVREDQKKENRKESAPPPPAPVIQEMEDLNIVSSDEALLDNIYESEASQQEIHVQQQSARVAPEKAIAASAAPISSNPQSKRVVTGKVTDQEGEPIIGATVRSDNRKQTLTDLEGKFAMEANDSDKLYIEYIGLESVTLPVDTGQTMLIAMHEDKQTLQESVVTAYGTQRKKAVKDSNKPQPVIGNKEYKKYLEENLVHPTDDECKNAKGKVTVFFFIDDNGRPYNFSIKKSLCPTADNEAIRLIEKGSDWTKGDKEVDITIKF